MPDIGSGSRVRMCYVEEVTQGTTPTTPTMLVLRTTGRNINVKKATLETAEVRSDRQISDVRHGFETIEGSIPFELANVAYDDMLEAAMGGAWAAVTIANDIGVTNPDQVVCSSNTLLTDGFRPGDIVTLGSLTASSEDGDYRVTAVAAGAMTLVNLDGTAAALTTEAEVATITMVLKTKRIDIGTTMKTYTMERQFLDIAEYQVFRGVAVNTMEFSIQPEQIVTCTMGLIGMDGDDPTSSPLDATPTAAATNRPMSAFDGVLFEGGATLGLVTGATITLDNGRSLKPVVGATTSPCVFEGSVDITGQIEVLFQDTTMLTKFTGETESSLWLTVEDPDDSGEFINIVMPRVIYTGGDIDPPAEGPIIVTMPFRALVDDSADGGGTTMSIQRSNA